MKWADWQKFGLEPRKSVVLLFLHLLPHLTFVPRLYGHKSLIRVLPEKGLLGFGLDRALCGNQGLLGGSLRRHDGRGSGGLSGLRGGQTKRLLRGRDDNVRLLLLLSVGRSLDIGTLLLAHLIQDVR